MPRLVYQTLGNGSWEVPYSDVLTIRKATELGAAPGPDIQSFVLGKPSDVQRRTISALVQVRPDGGSHYESAFAFDYSLRVVCDGTCYAAHSKNVELVFRVGRGWYMGLVRQDFHTFEAAMEWLAAHKRFELVFAERGR